MPSHLLTDRHISSLPNVTEAVNSTDEVFVVNSHDLHECQTIASYKCSWIRWREKYLLQLRECYSTIGSVYRSCQITSTWRSDYCS